MIESPAQSDEILEFDPLLMDVLLDHYKHPRNYGDLDEADIQHGEFFIWAIIPDTEAEKENRFFLIAATGGPEDSRTTKESHISTIMDGDYVWHVFEVRHE